MTKIRPCADGLVVTQPASGAPWKIGDYVSYSGTVYAAQPAVLDSGWAAPPASSALLYTGASSGSKV